LNGTQSFLLAYYQPMPYLRNQSVSLNITLKKNKNKDLIAI